MRFCTAALLFVVAMLPGGAPAIADTPEVEPKYAKPDLLIEVKQLRSLLESDEPPVILDTRSEEAYREGHIPTAQHVKESEWKTAFGEGTDVEGWSQRIAKHGITTTRTVVVYDEGITATSARVWWVLKYWGIEDVRMVNGGTLAWKEADFPLSQDLPKVEPVEFKAKPQKDRLVTYRQLKDILGEEESEHQIIDARTDAEFASGRIALCEHLDWQQLVRPNTGKMRSAAELKVLFERVGFDPAQPGITYCQSGGRASVMAFALELMGGEQVANYYGSWGEWSQKEGIETKPSQPQATPQQ